jgi:hypothetical protein
MRHAYDKNKAFVGEGYAIFGNSFNPSVSSSSTVERDRQQQNMDDYACSRLANYMFDEDISSDSENGFKNLIRD